MSATQTPDLRLRGDRPTAVVEDLRPGDTVVLITGTAVVICTTRHPIWPSLTLVVWRMSDGTLSPDALDPRQVVGELEPVNDMERALALLVAIDVDADAPKAWDR